jgi:hypothetical protein
MSKIAVSDYSVTGVMIGVIGRSAATAPGSAT